VIRAHNRYSNRDARRIGEASDKREYMTRGLRNCWCSGWLGFTLNLVRLVLGTLFRLLKTISARNWLDQPMGTVSICDRSICDQLRHSTISSQLRHSTISSQLRHNTISSQLRHNTISLLYSSSMIRLCHNTTSSPWNSTMNSLRRSMRHSELAQAIFQN